METIKSMTWSDFWAGLGFVATCILLTLVALSASADHRIQHYYMKVKSSEGVQQGCVMGFVDWDIDTTAFCTEDVSKRIEVMNALNASLK